MQQYGESFHLKTNSKLMVLEIVRIKKHTKWEQIVRNP